MRHFHEPAGFDDSDGDPAGWNRASYNHHPCDDFEPLPDTSSDYRQAALYHLKIMLAVDRYLETAPDARLAVIAVAVVLGWPSTRGLTVTEIADQLGISTSTIARACTRFREMAGLGVSAGGGVRFIRPGAGS
jgi:hypothetical protein